MKNLQESKGDSLEAYKITKKHISKTEQRKTGRHSVMQKWYVCAWEH